MKKEVKRNVLLFGILIIGTLFGVMASAPVWVGSTTNYSVMEDALYVHNLSNNITNFNGDVSFAIDTEQDISWTNTSGTYTITKDYISRWISIINSTTGNFSINATRDNQTGFFSIPIQATNTSDEEFAGTIFEFMINATNDIPSFSNINTTYNLTQDIELLDYVNATDEEEHYPLFFNISFFTNCTHAGWSGRASGENCSLFNLTDVPNTAALINFTPARNDVGAYWANISVKEYSTTCSSGYCESDYLSNKTNWSVVKLNVLSALAVNITNCTNQVLQENSNFVCYINITSKGGEDELNITNTALLRNYDSGQSYVSNTSWFYANQSASATNFVKTLTINVTPGKEEVGNWTINFTVEDLTSEESNATQIYVYVNRTIASSPFFDSIANQTEANDLAVYENRTIYINASDNDSLIPDKNDSFGGYNETLTFLSNTSWVSISTYEAPSGKNYTTSQIDIDYDTIYGDSGEGNYTIRVNVTDSEGGSAERIFVVEILGDTAASWNQSSYTFVIYEGNETYLNLSEYVSDVDEDIVTFSYVNDTSFSSLNSTSFNLSGIINFTAVDFDVGQHLLTINASDGKLDNETVFNFTILNINDAPTIQTPLQVNSPNATVAVATSNITTQEDNLTTITLSIVDEDVKIPSGQKSFYNESLDIDLTIEGVNTSLFSFTLQSTNPSNGLVIYGATFTPEKDDVGSYNITINVTDNSSSSSSLEFNITISEKEHSPILMALSNQTSAINRTIYYSINVTDTEDGNSNETGNANFTFSYSVLSGADIFNATTLNTTSGIINLTLNSSQDGKYHLNITVNDSTNKTDYADFWINVYGLPNITFPLSTNNFSLQENVSSNLVFRGNHSMGDNLTYLFYIDDIVYDAGNYTYGDLILRKNQSYYGNDTNLTWQFTPNFTDETYGKYKNLSLIVYPTTTELENASDLNKTLTWNLNVSYANSAVNFSGYIGDKETNYNADVEINLTSYFSDVDYSDLYYNQTVNFSIVSNSSPSYITSSVSDWILTLSSYQDNVITSERITVNASDWNGGSLLTSAVSNEFEVKFTQPSTTIVTVPTSGGGSSTKPVLLKIIVPGPLSVYKKERITIPITLSNTGKSSLSRITLTSFISNNNIVLDNIPISFDKSYFASLAIGAQEEVVLTADLDIEKSGTYEITINASVDRPKYSDWGKIYLTIKEINETNTLETLVFTEEFIVENPECIEIREMIDDARKSFEEGDYAASIEKSRNAVNACKDAISQQSLPREREKVEDKFYRYFSVFTFFAFILGISHYTYKKRKLRKMALR